MKYGWQSENFLINIPAVLSNIYFVKLQKKLSISVPLQVVNLVGTFAGVQTGREDGSETGSVTEGTKWRTKIFASLTPDSMDKVESNKILIEFMEKSMITMIEVYGCQ